MTERDGLIQQFQQRRAHLRKVAYRMLGSANAADDAVQEAWLRVSTSDTAAVENFGGWLTTLVARVCLDMLRARGARREEPVAERESSFNPEPDLLLADSVGPALLVVLETLGPAERVAFVLHDMFDLSFDEIAEIVDRTPEAARQLASRARRRIRGGAATPVADLDRQRQVVSAFLVATRDGDLDALLALLDPDVRLRADTSAVRTAAVHRWGGASELPSELDGARAVAETFKGRPLALQAALLDGVPGAVWVRGGQVIAAYAFVITDGKIDGIELIMDIEHLGSMNVVPSS